MVFVNFFAVHQAEGAIAIIFQKIVLKTVLLVNKARS